MTAPRPRTSFQEEVLDRLGRDICSRHYRDGEALPSEVELCARFNFSRTVIREAVKSLAAKGMVDVRRKVGTVVQDPSQWNLFDPDVISWLANVGAMDRIMMRDAIELRRIVEPAASRLTALRATAAQRSELRAAYEEMARAVAGKGDYLTADLRFHTTILSASGNQFLCQMRVPVGAILRVLVPIVTRKPGRTAFTLPLHEALCRAIEQGDAAAAEAASMRLVGTGNDDLVELLNLGSGT